MNSYRFKYEVDGEIKIVYDTKETDDYIFDIVDDGHHLKFDIHTKKKIRLISFKYFIDREYFADDIIFLNGYQTWTDSLECYPNQQLKDIRKTPKIVNKLFALNEYGDSYLVDYKKHMLHGYTYSYIKGRNPIFIGSYNDENAFLVIKHRISQKKLELYSDIRNLILDGNFKILNVIFNTNVEQGIKEYFDVFKSNAENLRGYTTWYNYYQNIDEKKIYENLEALDKKHFDLFQIDDGFETFVGDWLDVDQTKFPNGLAPIVERVHENGLKAGLWLSPFVAEQNSKLFKEHQDWFKRKNNELIKCGCNWSGFYALDFTNIEVKEYIKNVFEHYIKMGFDFFKLDFVYSVAKCEYDNYTHASIMHEALAYVRELTKDKLLLLCGVPLGSAFNLCDYCRIGPDVTLTFDDKIDPVYKKMMHRERISTRISIQNTLYRHHMNGKVFLNDPDVYIMRRHNNHLNKHQKEALATINILFGGLIMTSDNVSTYDEKTKKFIEDLYLLRDKIDKKEVDRCKNHIECKLILKNGEILRFNYYFRRGKLKWINR